MVLPHLKAGFGSAVIRDALSDGLQTITRHGQEVVVVVSADEFHRLNTPAEPVEDFITYLLSGPKIDDLEIERDASLTLGKMYGGVAHLAVRDPGRSVSLRKWVEGIEKHYSERILPVTREVVVGWAALNAERRRPAIDSLLAATALTHGLVMVTRNVSDFVGTGVDLVDPFAEGRRVPLAEPVRDLGSEYGNLFEALRTAGLP